VWGDPWIVVGALALESAIGYPAWLHRRLPHPVVWLGSLISALERAWNRSSSPPATRRLLGVSTILILIAVSSGAGWIIIQTPLPRRLSVALVIALGTLGLAQRSLHDHVAAVTKALAAGDLPTARSAVGMIVGRDVETLDESGVAVAALESVAESFNDAVVAPAFWFLAAGLPGLFIYKAINTADSMIGHMEPRWRDFGWAAARLDDLMNLVPARIAGALVALAGGGGWRIMLGDASKHASPNAGWPEAAMAGALRVRLGGPVAYDGVMTDRPIFGQGEPPVAADLRRGLMVYVRACGLLWMALLLGGFLWPR
jgi:adenosylcobinamide-phosphate synthase